MDTMLPKWLYIPWVLLLFVVAAILTFLDVISRRQHPIGPAEPQMRVPVSLIGRKYVTKQGGIRC